jgi:phenylalanyl-tRNA synthetase beta chain
VAEAILEVGNPSPPEPIPFRPQYANALLGTQYPEEAQIGILRRLGCRVEGEGPYRVTPPSHRLDLRLEEDLVEEVARIQGYETIPLDLPAFFPAPDNRGVEAPTARRRGSRSSWRAWASRRSTPIASPTPRKPPSSASPPTLCA